MNGTTNIDKRPTGQIDGFAYVAVGGVAQGHLEVHCASIEIVKLLMQTMGQWVAQNESSIVVPNGRPQ